MESWGRVLTAMVTPFNSHGELDTKRIGEIASYLIGNGTDTLVLSGTTGESPTLTIKEKLKLFELTRSAAFGTKLISSTGSYNTAESIELTREAAKLGMDAIMLVSPYYNRPNQEGLYQHFAAIAESTELPIMIYNIPGRTAVNLEVPTLLRLCKISNIRAVKEASGNLAQISDTIAQAPKSLTVYCGDDGLTLPILSLGGYGVVSVTSHIVGNDIAKMIKLYNDGKVKEAAAIHHKMTPIVKAIFSAPSPSPLKYALALMGEPVGGTRLPLAPLNSNERQLVESAMQEYGLINKAVVSIAAKEAVKR